MRIRALIASMIVLVALALTIVGYILYHTYETYSPLVVAAVAPTAIPIQEAPVLGNVVAEGTIVPCRQATLAFKIGGAVTTVMVKEGDTVQAGATLIRLSDTDLRTQVKQADAALNVARAELNRTVVGASASERQAAKDALAAAQSKYDAAVNAKSSASTLKEAAAGISQAKSAIARLDPSPEALAVAQAQLDQAQAALNTAQVALDQATLAAPFAGTAAEVKVNIGDFVGPGIPVAILGDLSSLSVQSTDISDLDIGRVKVGQKVNVTLTALPGKVFHGIVARISPMASESRGYKVFEVWIDMKEGIDSGLRWGMDTKIEILSQ